MDRPKRREMPLVRRIRATPEGWVAEGRVHGVSYEVDAVPTRQGAMREAAALERALWDGHGVEREEQHGPHYYRLP